VESGQNGVDDLVAHESGALLENSDFFFFS
jgi:hypothetical protein